MTHNEYEAWRPALIAFYREDGPWFQKVENLGHGAPLTAEDMRVIDGLRAAAARMPKAA